MQRSARRQACPPQASRLCYDHGHAIRLIGAIVFLLIPASPNCMGQLSFRHHFGDADLRGRSMGQTDLADLDNDGDLDFITGEQRGRIFWYEFQSPGSWVRHELGVDSPSDVGGVALDVNQDGWVDFVTGGAWYENTATPKDSRFDRHVFDAELAAVHDIVLADLDGDGQQDVVTMSDKNDLRWYRVSPEPGKRWARYTIGESVHSGISTGDLDSDGDVDVVRSNIWFENQDRGKKWTPHKMTEPWGAATPPFAVNATQTEIVDLNSDGRLDVVICDGENPGSKIAWLEAPSDPRSGEWLTHYLPRGDTAARGALHSLKVADFDLDGDVDIFTVEMERFAGEKNPRWFIWENTDGKGTLIERVILDANLGGHEAVCGDVDADGDLDICAKPWSPRRNNALGGRNHFDFLENLAVGRQDDGQTEKRKTTFPSANWESATPESQGLDSAELTAAINKLKAGAGSDGVRELMIIRGGYLVWHGDNIDKVHGVWSCTKSFTSTCLGLLIEDGKCSLDAKASQFVPAMATSYPAVTLRHFTTMTSGYRAVGDETEGSYTHGPSKTPFQPHTMPLFHPPGTQYAYWDSAMNQFANVLTRIAGQPLDELFRRRIAEPIGMDDAAWRWGDFGSIDDVRVNGGAGNNNRHVFISARQMARLGLLFLNNGNWNGKQLINREWVPQATAVHVAASVPNAWPQSDIHGSGYYGFNWWRNGIGPDGKRKWPAAPASTYAASGYNNNKLFVIPSWDMVIVRLGLDQNDKKITDATWSEFLAGIGSTLGQ